MSHGINHHSWSHYARVGVTLSRFGLRLSGDQSHPCHCKNSVGLWLHGYKFDLGEGLTQLTGTVVTWRMYALYWVPFSLILYLLRTDQNNNPQWVNANDNAVAGTVRLQSPLMCWSISRASAIVRISVRGSSVSCSSNNVCVMTSSWQQSDSCRRRISVFSSTTTTKTKMVFYENKLVFVTMTTTTKFWEFSSKWRRWRQKLTNFRQRGENCEEKVSDEDNNDVNSTILVDI